MKTVLRVVAAGLLLALAAAPSSAAPASAPPAPAAAAAPSAAAPSGIIPVEAFGALPFLSDPEISPDGLHIVASSVVDGKKALVLADVGAADFAVRTIGLPDKVDVMWTKWAGRHRILISMLVPTDFMGIELKTVRLFVYDLDTRQAKALTDKVGGFDGDNVIFIDPAGEYILLSAQRSLFDWPSVLRFDFATMKAKEVVHARDGVSSWYADPNGIVRAGLGGDRDRWWLYYRASADDDFHRIGKGDHQDTLTDLEKLLPTSGSATGYAIANKATGRYGVYRYDFATATIGEPVYENQQVDVDGVSFSARTGELDSVDYVDDRDEVFWLDPTMKRLQARFDKALPGFVNRIVSRDADDGRMIVWSTSASDPGTYYVFDRTRNELREFARPYAQLDGRTLSPVATVHYAARDGLDIPAYLTLPAGRAAKGLPLILMPHGGPFVRDKWAYDPWVQFLASRGYAVLQPNYRGSTGYGKSYVEAATGQWGRKMQDDLDDGVAWLVARGIVDPKRVCIMGASYGGYAAMWAAVRNPDIYRCAISLAGISDMSAMLRYDSAHFQAPRYFRDWRDRIRGDQHLDLASISALPRAADIRIPMLIAHGKDDGNVPPSQSIKLHEALQKAGRVHEYVLYPDEGHGFSKAADSVDFLKRVEAFLARYNPAS